MNVYQKIAVIWYSSVSPLNEPRDHLDFFYSKLPLFIEHFRDVPAALSLWPWSCHSSLYLSIANLSSHSVKAALHVDDLKLYFTSYGMSSLPRPHILS